MQPLQHTAVDDDSATHAGAHDEAGDDRAPAGRSERRFGERKAVGVVGDAHLRAQRRREIVPQGPTVEADRVAVLHQPGRRFDGARCADADDLRAHVTTGVCHRLDQRAHALHDVLVAALAFRRPAQAKHRSLGLCGIENHALELGAAEIDAPDAHGGP